MQGDGSLWSQAQLHQFISQFSDSRFAEIVRHWLALRQQDAIPHRGSVDPARFKSSLDMVWLMERHDDGHYRYRLAGEKIAEIHGGICRDSDTVELFSAQALEMFRPRWEAVLDQGCLVRAEGVVKLAKSARVSRVERLMLPLRGDKGEVSVILGATHYDRPRGADLTASDFPPTNIQWCPTTEIPLGSNG